MTSRDVNNNKGTIYGKPPPLLGGQVIYEISACVQLSAPSPESPGCCVHSAAVSKSPSPHASSPSVSCLAQEEGKGISLAPGSATRQPEQWKGSVSCSRSPLALAPSKPRHPGPQDDDGLQRGPAYLLVQGWQSCSQGSPASLLSLSPSKHFKSFPLLLKEKLSSLPRPRVI